MNHFRPLYLRITQIITQVSKSKPRCCQEDRQTKYFPKVIKYFHPVLARTNPLPKPHRTGEYSHHHHHQHGGQAGEPGQEMADYGPASYVPGDRCVASTDRFRHPLVVWVVSVTSVCKHLEDGKHGE